MGWYASSAERGPLGVPLLERGYVVQNKGIMRSKALVRLAAGCENRVLFRTAYARVAVGSRGAIALRTGLGPREGGV